MTTGIKTYNEAVNITHDGKHADTIAHILQRQGFAIGVVTSVPVSHATPACAYSHNVSRDDYQDLSRDLLGLPSISHGGEDCKLAECNVPPLPGVDVLIGAGWGQNAKTDADQGANFLPGNKYLADADLKKVDVANGGKYTVAQRTKNRDGAEVLREGADEAIAKKTRFLGYFGATQGHLPFRTADGDYKPTYNVKRKTKTANYLGHAEQYSEADVKENPILADFATQALRVLNARSDKFWMMIEAGDVDWANHANNIDSSIGAVISGDMAFKAICDWVEKEKAWDDTAIIVTADHGHYLVLTRPDMLVGK
jgi:alkaline phosphatase